MLALCFGHVLSLDGSLVYICGIDFVLLCITFYEEICELIEMPLQRQNYQKKNQIVRNK